MEKMRPGSTPEARENQMISLAMDLVEKRLIAGTATSQETTHFLKLASAKEQLEREKISYENELLKVKTEAIQSSQQLKDTYDDVLKAFRTYSGQEVPEDDDEEY